MFGITNDTICATHLPWRFNRLVTMERLTHTGTVGYAQAW
jgi:hypothetical protein